MHGSVTNGEVIGRNHRSTSDTLITARIYTAPHLARNVARFQRTMSADVPYFTMNNGVRMPGVGKGYASSPPRAPVMC